MGMAASQARWISLAARKSNVEYEGQQINQARTALANRSSELWNELYKMDVPTAPNSSDYTKTQYSFNADNTKKTIDNIQKVDYTDPDGKSYNSYVTYYSQVEEYTGVQKSNYNPQVHRDSTGESYMVGTKNLTQLSKIDKTDENWPSYEAALEQIYEDMPDCEVAKDWLSYKNGSTTALQNIFFWNDTAGNVNFSDINGVNGLNNCLNDPSKTLYSYYAENQIHNKTVSEYAYVEYDTNGRATSMELRGSTAVYDLSAESVTDNTAYTDAMNNYNYNKQVYEKKVQDINAKTEQIQTEDRTLEIRLKQLDTEQTALQTEMDVVHKLISKNIDNTFKTFES
ncbi:hypothetical protein IJ579_08155 [bacterium]|nr:hypothetical protein [bacterium]